MGKRYSNWIQPLWSSRLHSRYGIRYPVPIDNEFKTWKAYKNEYWPQIYLTDRQGNLVYGHIGEGAYSTTEQTIQKLLG